MLSIWWNIYYNNKDEFVNRINWIYNSTMKWFILNQKILVQTIKDDKCIIILTETDKTPEAFAQPWIPLNNEWRLAVEAAHFYHCPFHSVVVCFSQLHHSQAWLPPRQPPISQRNVSQMLGETIAMPLKWKKKSFTPRIP